MLIKSDTDLIQVWMAYYENVIGALFHLMNKILNLRPCQIDFLFSATHMHVKKLGALNLFIQKISALILFIYYW